MTRKDFELIASTLKGYGDADKGLIDALARSFADALRTTNKQFNRDKFIRACGVTP
jgi:hypothetical protein